MGLMAQLFTSLHVSYTYCSPQNIMGLMTQLFTSMHVSYTYCSYTVYILYEEDPW